MLPFLAKFTHTFWMKLSEMMGYVMSKVVLGIVFFLFLITDTNVVYFILI